MDVKAEVEKLDATVKKEVKTLKEDMKRGHESIQEEVRRLREELRQSPAPIYTTGPFQVIQIHVVNSVESIRVAQTGLPTIINHPSGSPQLPQTVRSERSCAIPIHPDQEQPVGAEGCSEERQLNQQNPPDEIHIWNVILSFKESFLLFAKYLKYKLNVDVRSHEVGSLLITVECSSLQILEGLWEDYCSGHLNQIAQEVLVTADVLEKLGVTDVKLKTFISEEEYEKGKQIFMDNSAISVEHSHLEVLHVKAAGGSESKLEAKDTVSETALGKRKRKDNDDGLPKEKHESREAEELITQMLDIRIIVENVVKTGGPATSSPPKSSHMSRRKKRSRKSKEEGEKGEEEKGFPSEHEQGRSIWSAIMSVEGPVENFLSQYLESKLNLVVGSHRIGSLLIRVECRSLQILEELWKDYCSGHLNEMAQEMIVTPYVLATLGVTDVKLKTFISEEEYQRGKQILKDAPEFPTPTEEDQKLHKAPATKEVGSKCTSTARN
ncbi:hypothetical protein OS493_026285 [Desmophyllum pertusum]|uniref:TRADD-like N-terminal domain-containing protein n=1 Tax=Desmophyllum pertusum TaxID=174260 RepID=A0A9W9ZPS9_9CNID|nr:hypothetical protein OS493_026285 [Desmophyllum pertusum]